MNSIIAGSMKLWSPFNHVKGKEDKGLLSGFNHFLR